MILNHLPCARSVLSLAPDPSVQPHCIALNSIQRRVRAFLCVLQCQLLLRVADRDAANSRTAVHRLRTEYLTGKAWAAQTLRLSSGDQVTVSPFQPPRDGFGAALLSLELGYVSKRASAAEYDAKTLAKHILTRYVGQVCQPSCCFSMHV